MTERSKSEQPKPLEYPLQSSGRTSGGIPEQAAAIEYRPRPTDEFLAENAALYRVAYDESVNALKTQSDELSGMRQRLVSFLAFVGSATAFLAGSALTATQSTTTQSGHRSDLFYGVAAVASLLMLAVITYTVNILRPKSAKIIRAASAYRIVEGHIETDIPTNEGHLLRNLALRNDEAVQANRSVLVKLRRDYVTAIALGSLELVALIGLVWFCT
ncbi:hypothetical protein [Mycobacterium intracellulare]|uniref:Uncharacterized protein n=1 Tax=Mycobacterium intracellulare TaxID=1767 RepID=A0A7R7RLP6_MYCIT|nr:hypothetical protein [Mycobacterium intracellulare]BCO99318.1 hypothetical protein MINTM018_20880 [Mycobacterium intracellulare]